MIKKLTPETDSFAIKFKTPCGEKYWVPSDFSRKLEQERDEAQDRCSKLEKEKDVLRIDVLRKTEDYYHHLTVIKRLELQRDIAEDERIDMAQQLESEKQCHARCQNERDAMIQKLDAWQEIAEHLHHLVQHPAYGVDQAIRRMDVLEAYKHLKNE